MSSEQNFSDQEQLLWRGIHHIALATADLDATIRFYEDVLGMQASKIAPSKEGRGRHCLILLKPGDNDIWGFHFFERPQAVEGLSSGAVGSTSGFLLHIALRLSSETMAGTLRESLQRAGTAITEIPELGSFLFPDNNGLLLEATWPRKEAM